MIRFTPRHPRFELTERTQHGRAVWRLLAPIHVGFATPDAATSMADFVVIPAGFETDGASIPAWARWKFDPWGRVGLSAVLHDYLLSLPSVAKWDADLAFLHGLRSQGLPAFMSTLFYFAVRLRRRRPVTLNQRRTP